MSSHQPTGSVTGPAGWEWNRRHGDGGDRPTDPRPSPGPRVPEHESPESPDALRRRVEHLEAELARKDQEMDAVVERYEALLQERSARANHDVGSDPSSNQVRRVISRLKGRLPLG